MIIAEDGSELCFIPWNLVYFRLPRISFSSELFIVPANYFNRPSRPFPGSSTSHFKEQVVK